MESGQSGLVVNKDDFLSCDHEDDYEENMQEAKEATLQDAMETRRKEARLRNRCFTHYQRLPLPNGGQGIVDQKGKCLSESLLFAHSNHPAPLSPLEWSTVRAGNVNNNHLLASLVEYGASLNLQDPYGKANLPLESYLPEGMTWESVALKMLLPEVGMKLSGFIIVLFTLKYGYNVHVV
jgi:hypothetical protein